MKGFSSDKQRDKFLRGLQVNHQYQAENSNKD